MYLERHSRHERVVNYRLGADAGTDRAGALRKLQLFLNIRRDNEEERRSEFYFLFRELSILANSKENNIPKQFRDLGIGTRYTREFYNIKRRQLGRSAGVPNQFIILLEHLILPAELFTPGIEMIADSLKTTRQILEKKGREIAEAIGDREGNERIENFLNRAKRYMAQRREVARRAEWRFTSS